MTLLPAMLLTLVTTTLVLQSGDRLTVDGPVTEENGRVTFRVRGTLYTMAASEIARIEEQNAAVPPAAAVPRPREERVPLSVSPARRKELLEELEKSRSGLPPIVSSPIPKLPEPTVAEAKEQTREEWYWRREARTYDEAVRRAEEDLEMLLNREDELTSKIWMLLSQGYKPHQFTYDSGQLVRTREELPHARLELERAVRARDQFLEDARRQGVLPGWLR